MGLDLQVGGAAHLSTQSTETKFSCLVDRTTQRAAVQVKCGVST